MIEDTWGGKEILKYTRLRNELTIRRDKNDRGIEDLFVAYTTEGRTDERFLGNVIRRTFEELAWECTGKITVYYPQHKKVSEQNFADQVVGAALEAKWSNILCVHADADDTNHATVFILKIHPAFNNINNFKRSYPPAWPAHARRFFGPPHFAD